MRIIKAEELPDQEEVYLKKDWLGWRVVDPVKHPETGMIIWKNVFNKKGFLLLIILLLLLGIGYLGFNEQIDNYKKVMSDPCPYCSDCQNYVIEKMEQINSQKYSQPINFNLK